MARALSGVFEQFLADRSLYLAPKSILVYSRMFVPVNRFLQDKWPITRDDIERFLYDRRQKVSPTTLNMHLRQMSTFFRWCVSRRFLPKNPMDQLTFKRVRERPKISDTLSRDDLARVLRHCACQPHHNRRDFAIIAAMADTGMRPGELCNLFVGDFNEQECSLHLDGKTGGRLVPVTPLTARAIHTYLQECGDPPAQAPLFCQESGKPLIREDLNCIFWRIKRKLGLQKLYPYQLRHTFATEFLRNGGNMEALRRMLGHAGLNLIQRYAHLNFSDLMQAQLQASPIAHIRVHIK